MTQAYGDFTLGESIRVLKETFSRYFKTHAMDVDMQFGETAELLTMLEKRKIKCGSYSFHSVKDLPEAMQTEAEQLAELLRKKSYSRTLRNALHVFSEQQYDLHRTKHGAIYYPELKLYVCVGYLTPKVLMRLLTDPDCEQVAVFASMAKWDRKNHYLLFECGGSREKSIDLQKA